MVAVGNNGVNKKFPSFNEFESATVLDKVESTCRARASPTLDTICPSIVLSYSTCHMLK